MFWFFLHIGNKVLTKRFSVAVCGICSAQAAQLKSHLRSWRLRHPLEMRRRWFVPAVRVGAFNGNHQKSIIWFVLIFCGDFTRRVLPDTWCASLIFWESLILIRFAVKVLAGFPMELWLEITVLCMQLPYLLIHCDFQALVMLASFWSFKA